MTSREVATLKLNEAIVVTFGRNGSQYARVIGFRQAAYTGTQLVKVRKYRRNSQSWTKTVIVSPEEILFRANDSVPALPAEAVV